MLCRFRPLFVAALALTSLGLSACKSIYSDTYSWRKNDFVPPPEKKKEDLSKIAPPIEATPQPQPVDLTQPAVSDPNAIPGLAPATDGTMPVM